jgi:hypothetical protein
MKARLVSLAFAITPIAGTPHATAAEPIQLDTGPDWLVTLSGQLRPRFLAHSGLDFRGEASEYREIVTQRARLGATIEEASGLAFELELQDVRAWGEEDSTLDADANGFDAHQAYAQIPISDVLRLKLGRQEIALGQERLIGTMQWTQRARAFDGGTLAWNSLDERFTISALYAKIHEPGQSADASVPAGRDGDIDLGGVYSAIQLRGEHEIAPLYLIHIQQTPNDVRHTLGFSSNGGGQGFCYIAEAYYQFGKIDEATINAYLLALRMGYAFKSHAEPAVLLWAEALSGDGTPQGTFDTLYGTNHDYYGEMDLFLNVARDTQNLGLIDLGGRAETRIIGNLRARVDGHYFRSFHADATGSAELGVELDFELSYQANDYVSVDGLYGLFLPGDVMRTVKGYDEGLQLRADSLFYLTAELAF